MTRMLRALQELHRREGGAIPGSAAARQAVSSPAPARRSRGIGEQLAPPAALLPIPPQDGLAVAAAYSVAARNIAAAYSVAARNIAATIPEAEPAVLLWTTAGAGSGNGATDARLCRGSEVLPPLAAALLAQRGGEALVVDGWPDPSQPTPRRSAKPSPSVLVPQPTAHEGVFVTDAATIQSVAGGAPPQHEMLAEFSHRFRLILIHVNRSSSAALRSLAPRCSAAYLLVVLGVTSPAAARRAVGWLQTSSLPICGSLVVELAVPKHL